MLLETAWEAVAHVGQNRTDTSKFRAEPKVLPRDEWPTRLRRLVSEQVSLILRRPIDPDRPLYDCGQPRTAHAHRDRNGNTRRLHGHPVADAEVFAELQVLKSQEEMWLR
jgi:hypothetical protein